MCVVYAPLLAHASASFNQRNEDVVAQTTRMFVRHLYGGCRINRASIDGLAVLDPAQDLSTASFHRIERDWIAKESAAVQHTLKGVDAEEDEPWCVRRSRTAGGLRWTQLL